MDDASLTELYFRTVLELRDDSGQLFRITPIEPDASGSDGSVVLSPFSDAYILTAENPESSGTQSAEENAQATRALGQMLDDLPVVFRDCPGYAFDSDHVEPGFAVLAHDYESDSIKELVLGLASRFRQNAIFHLSPAGLSIIGAVRDQMTGFRPVVIERV